MNIHERYLYSYIIDISIVSSYVYDKGLVFGAQYKIKDNIVSFGQNISVVSNLLIDSNLVTIDKPTEWDSFDSGFFYQLFLNCGFTTLQSQILNSTIDLQVFGST